MAKESTRSRFWEGDRDKIKTKRRKIWKKLNKDTKRITKKLV